MSNVISLAKWQLKSRLLLAFFSLSICLIPFQKAFKGVLGRVAKILIPAGMELPKHFSKTIPCYLSDLSVLLFLTALVVYFRPSIKRLFWEGPTKFLTLFFGVGCVSLLGSQTPSYLLQYIHLAHFYLYALIFSAIVFLYKIVGREVLIKVCFLSLVGVGVFEGCVAICQYFFQTNVGLSLLGELSLSHFPFSWNSGSLFLGGSVHEGMLFRASGTFSHPNILGALLFCSLMATSYLYLKQQRWLYALAFGVQLMALFVTFSRAALFTFAIAGVLFLMLQGRVAWKMMIGPCIAVIIALVALMPALLTRGGIINYNGTVQGADRERLCYNKIAFDLWQENPWLGVGYNNFQLSSQLSYPEMPGHQFHSKVHNIYLLALSETGLLGCFFLLAFFARVLYKSARQLKSGQLERAMLFSLLVGLLVMGCFDFFLITTSVGGLILFSTAGLLYLCEL